MGAAVITQTVATTATAAAPASPRRAVRSEWIKLRSVRSNVVGLAAAAAAMVVFGALFSSLAGSDQQAGPPTTDSDPLTIAFAGINLAQLVIGVLAAVAVTTEYATGMIRATFVAVVRRGRVVAAKAAVTGVASWVVMTLGGLGAFLAGSATYAGDEPVHGIGDDGVLRAIAGVGIYAAAIAVLGVSIGFLLRRTAAAVGTLVATIMVAPVLAGLLPGDAGDAIAKVLPSNAGRALMSVADNPDLLSPAAGVAVLAVWVTVAVAAAAWVVRRRDV